MEFFLVAGKQIQSDLAVAHLNVLQWKSGEETQSFCPWKIRQLFTFTILKVHVHTHSLVLIISNF